MNVDVQLWKACSTCKKSISFGATYWKCGVSTCNRKSTAYAFCSLPCWECHVPIYNHRDAWADESRAPRSREEAEQPKPRGKSRGGSTMSGSSEKDVLVVASKLKAYIKDRAGMNTSGGVMPVLSDRIRSLCDQAIDNARSDGRKTVLDRDFG